MKITTVATALVLAVMLAGTAEAGLVQQVDLVVTAGIGPGGGHAYDFMYTNSDGNEFIMYSVVADFTAAVINDPIRGANGQQDDVTAGTPLVAVDTFFNTAYSATGFGNASHTFDDYNPAGGTPDIQPTDSLDWTVFDTASGDDVAFHLGRLLLNDPAAVGTVTIIAQDEGHAGEELAETFVFDIPEPATMLVLLGGALLAVIRRR